MRTPAGTIAVQPADGFGNRPEKLRAGPRGEIHAAVAQRAAVEPLGKLAGDGISWASGFHRGVGLREEMYGIVGHAVASQRDGKPERQVGPNTTQQPETVRWKIPRVGG